MTRAACLLALSLAVAAPALAGPVAQGTLDDARAMIPALGLVEVPGAPVPVAAAAVAVTAPLPAGSGASDKTQRQNPPMTCREMFDAFKAYAEKRGEQASPKKICEWMRNLRCDQDPGKPDPC